jgi:septal ring factor EnvC (AmiA/AmiB activator)
MKRLIDFILANASVLALALIIVYLAFGGYGACVHTAKYYQKIGEMNQLVKENIRKIDFLNRQIYQLEQQNITIQKKNELLAQKISQLEQSLAAGAKRIEELEKTRPNYPAECQPIVDHLSQEIEAWKSQFSLAIADRDAWKEKALNFQTLYENAEKINGYQKEQIEALGAQIAKQNDVIRELNKQVKFSIFKEKAFQISAVIVGGLIIYSLMKK